ncbi:hypothetical protein LTR35_000009 [Friedmanniomyces endolithicus]|uniref:Uncharacterized protein n=1 Tax=Friedmanniomyces endolithicus TaxID=329885 RepID=A0AAN6FJT3_9PEZI|nr:hypothetical protein LTS00_017622 [Friedmanniomyces endolithicus]KAK0293405.1 hypothetical protein LTR35_000009 [Friedmanniomyces endolithicus]KAK0319021.1 hypothetical protein LTR82_010121 [Friedmanniomyces endolithicus]KAK0997455.1 hypothetical protein LTR54_009915 [Friedmanniomyces endolithicus]
MELRCCTACAKDRPVSDFVNSKRTQALKTCAQQQRLRDTARRNESDSAVAGVRQGVCEQSDGLISKAQGPSTTPYASALGPTPILFMADPQVPQRFEPQLQYPPPSGSSPRNQERMRNKLVVGVHIPQNLRPSRHTASSIVAQRHRAEVAVGSANLLSAADERNDDDGSDGDKHKVTVKI